MKRYIFVVMMIAMLLGGFLIPQEFDHAQQLQQPTPPPPIMATKVPPVQETNVAVRVFVTMAVTNTPTPYVKAAPTDTPIPTYPTIIGEPLEATPSVLPEFLPRTGEPNGTP